MSRPRWRWHRAWAAALAAAWLLPVAAQEQVTLDRIIAVVNEDIILKSELDYRRRLFMAQQRQSNQPLPPADLLDRQLLDALIAARLQLQIAQQEGVRVEDGMLDSMLTDIARRNDLDLERFRSALERDGFEFERFREGIREEMLLTRLRSSRVDNRVDVTDQEVEHFLTTMEFQGEGGDEYLVGHILVAIPDTTGVDAAALRQKALGILQRLDEGEDFSALARAHSDSVNAPEGGLLEWRKLDELPTRFAQVIPDMQVGDYRGLLEDTYGYHIVRLFDRRRGVQLMIEQARARHILIRPGEQENAEEVRAHLAELRARVQAGEDFSELASAHSQDITTSLKGGELGWISEGQLEPAFDTLLAQLPLNEVSEPFESSMGWHLVEVLERRRHDSTDEMLRNRARELIRERKIKEARRSWLDQLRDEAYIEYRLQENLQDDGFQEG